MRRKAPKIYYSHRDRQPRRTFHEEIPFDPTMGEHTLHVKNGFHAERCHGEAHSNAYIDHCMTCLGHAWGYLAVKDKS